MRTRTLSEEGQRLFLEGICLPKPKRSLRQLVYSCFHTEYDDRLDHVVTSCRESTKTLIKMLIDSNIDDRIEAALMNTVKLILSNNISQNYRFYLNVMEQAFKKNDHQTAMLMYLSLTHSAVQRLSFKRPKRSKEVIDSIAESYGSVNNCYSNHVYEMLHTNESGFLPSAIALSMYMDDKYAEACKRMGHQMDDETFNDVRESCRLYGYLYLRNNHLMPLYESEGVCNRDLFELSEQIQKKQKKGLKRTKKQSICWSENPI